MPLKRRQDAGQSERHRLDEPDVDAGQARGLHVAADRIDRSAEPRVVHQEMHGEEGRRKDIDRKRDAEQITAAEILEPARKGGQREAAGDQIGHAAQGGEHGERGDEGRNVEILPHLAGEDTR